MRSLTILIILVLTATALPAQSDVSLAMPGYRVSVAGPLAEGPAGGLVVAKLDSLPRDRRAARFGVLFAEAATSPVLELQDGVSGATLATVTSSQWSGRESAGWKRLPERSSSGAGRVVEAFSLLQGKTSMTIERTFEQVAAPHLPLGHGLRVSISVANASVPSVRVVFRGVLQGSAVVNGTLLTIASAERQVPMNASLMLVWSEGVSVRLEGSAKSRSLMAQSKAVTAASDEPVPAMEVTIAGSTSPVPEHQTAQASALLGTMQGKASRPLLVARTVVDRPKAMPGDTVAYALTYYNVGTAPATDVELENPIPDGTRYLDSSAQGQNCEILEEREKVDLPKVGRILNLVWKFDGAIAPGESRLASFKVIVL